MSDEERARLGTLSTHIHANRGAPGENAIKATAGISWTLDREVAESFAKRAREWFKKPSTVVEAKIPRAAVVAYINERQEGEVVVDWRKVRDSRIVTRFAMPADERASAGPTP